jgi:hypothetical protein
MAPRKTRQKIRDHVDMAIKHMRNAGIQLAEAMEMGEDRSPICYHLIPKAIEMILACVELIEKIKSDL